MISIIIPTFNEEAFLPRLLASIKAQDFEDVEIIVADNDSKDRTREIARRAGAKVVRGGLPGQGRNRGAEAASGELLLFLDADTVLPVGFLTRLFHKMEGEFVDICIPWYKPIDGDKPIYRTIFKLSCTWFKLMEGIQPQGLGVCILVTARLHRRIGGFDEKKRVSEDFDYINRASLVGRFRVFTGLYVYHSVRRYAAEGAASLVQRQLKGGVLFFTGKPYDDIEYEFGQFSRYLQEERDDRASSAKNAEVKKLLSNFTRESNRLKTQIEELSVKKRRKEPKRAGKAGRKPPRAGRRPGKG